MKLEVNNLNKRRLFCVHIVMNLETMRTQHAGPKVSYAGKYVCSQDPGLLFSGRIKCVRCDVFS